ncbi:hypothetical protein SAMN05192561_11220 [Halopenitus malekzadehii]|uniref:Uncharacterized protein n=1 Tax=Halopenitus malekzadehii TaxID=1267564 RepID=A0A1H6JNJ7_9EURY|nr:hypothetical protein [Halopenitus malekzadehii]SEH60611.1 hypothetical protein SAMN05192561_11220 [Halopenitus malekzadehii]
MTTTISLPDDVVDDLDEHLPDDRTREEQFREVVLPALEGDHVEIVNEADTDDVVLERLDELDSRIDEIPTLTSTKTVKNLRSELQ